MTTPAAATSPRASSTIATGEPAYYPWVIDDAPESGEGFESAIAYAVAEQLGFDADDVVGVRTTFDEAIAPGPKSFDFNLQQFSITDERKQNVDFSSPYYETTQVVITTEASRARRCEARSPTSRRFLIGAQTGTTSLDAINEVIKPTAGAQVFNTNDDAKLALESGTVDAIVVDLPTAFYLTGVELTGGLIIGQLPEAGQGRRVRPRARKGQPADRRRDRRRRCAARTTAPCRRSRTSGWPMRPARPCSSSASCSVLP